MTAGKGTADGRMVFACVRRVCLGGIVYALVLPAARLFGAEPLLEHEAVGLFAHEAEGLGDDGTGFPVALSRPLLFDPLDEERGFGIVTLPRDIRFGFDGAPEIRHGMVRVMLIAPRPATVWRLDEPLLPAAA